jgi:hypothetical protein
MLNVSKASGVHRPHQSGGSSLCTAPETHKAQITDTDESSLCSTSVEDEPRKVLAIQNLAVLAPVQCIVGMPSFAPAPFYIFNNVT